jgi:COX assembly mitochondrial protein 1
MNSCMVQHATQAEMDKAREDWFRGREARRREREEKEVKRKENEKLHREWWGLDEQGRRKLPKSDEKR